MAPACLKDADPLRVHHLQVSMLADVGLNLDLRQPFTCKAEDLRKSQVFATTAHKNSHESAGLKAIRQKRHKTKEERNS